MAEINVIRVVVGVWATVIEQFPVFSVAPMAMLTRLVPLCVCVTNTAVRRSRTGTTSHQLVPSLPTTQFSFR